MRVSDCDYICSALVYILDGIGDGTLCTWRWLLFGISAEGWCRKNTLFAPIGLRMQLDMHIIIVGLVSDGKPSAR